MFNNINKILLTAVAVLAIAIVMLSWRSMRAPEDEYYAVFTSGGDLFFGQAHYFPRFYLTDVWILQRNPEDEKNPFSLGKFDQTFWGPGDKLYLNKKNILWKTKLRSDSQVVQQIKSGGAPFAGQLPAVDGIGGLPSPVVNPPK